MQIKKYETKDRYGNSKSFEFFEGSADMDVPSMTSMPNHPGEPRGTDTVPAWLTPGEMVINKEATDMYGEELTAINNEGRAMQNGEQHDPPSEAMYAAAGDVVTPATQMSEDEIYRYLIDDLEFTSNAAKGIMSNINSETAGSFSGAQAQFGGGPGRGLAQWEMGGRYDTDPTNLVKFAAQRNIDPADAKTQLDFLDYEMRPNTDTLPEKLADGSNNPDYAPWRKFGDLRVRMNEAETPGEAATLFMNEYEKPDDRSQDRYTYADNYLAGVDDTPPIKELSLAPEIALDTTDTAPIGPITVEDLDESIETVDPIAFGPMDSYGIDEPLSNKNADQSMELDSIDSYGNVPELNLDDSITVSPLGLTGRERDAEIATIEAQLAEQEVATEDPSFLDRAGDFISGAVSNYRKGREGYRKKYVDHYGHLGHAGKGYFDSIYKESGGPVPQYYAAGDEVRDYYRSGIPMPGSAPTYSSSNAPTWETMADGIKEKVEDDQAKRKRLMQLERFGSAEGLSMDRLQTMRLKEKLAKLKRERAEAKQAAYDNSTAREDAFNKNYYTGISGDVPPSDEFSSIPRDYYDERDGNYDKPRRPSTHTEKFGASLFDLVENPDSTGDGYMIPELELVDKRKVPANSGYRGAEYQDPRVPPPMNTSIPSADEYSNTGSTKQMQSDIKEEDYLKALQLEEGLDESRDFDSPDSVRTLTEAEQKERAKKKVKEFTAKDFVPSGFVIGDGTSNFIDNIDDVKTSKENKVLKNKDALINAIKKGGSDSQVKELKRKWEQAQADVLKVQDTKIVQERISKKVLAEKEFKRLTSEYEEQALIAKRAKENGLETIALDAESKAAELALELEDKKTKLIEANETYDSSFTKQGNLKVTTGLGDGNVDSDELLNVNTGALKSRLDAVVNSGDGTDSTVSVDPEAVKNAGEGVVKKDPIVVVKTEGFLKKFFGDLFDSDELKRMAILYLGSRAMGASHSGSLAWSGKYYLKRVETNDANHTARVAKAIATKLYTPASIELYKNSRKESDLIPISGGGATYNLKGNNKEYYSSKANKARTGIQVERTRADGSKDTYYTFNPSDPKKSGYMQPISLDWNQKNASQVKGTDAYKERTKKAADALAGSLDEMITINKDDQNGGTLEMQRLTVGPDTLSLQVAKFAEDHDLNLGASGEVSRLAFEAMKKDLALNKKLTVGNIKPYLNAAMIRQRSGIGAELFESADKKPNATQVINFNSQLANAGKVKIKDVSSGQGQGEMIDRYRQYYQMFQADMSGSPTSFEINGAMVSMGGNKSNIQAAENNLKKGESLFMAWVRREIAGLNP